MLNTPYLTLWTTARDHRDEYVWPRPARARPSRRTIHTAGWELSLALCCCPCEQQPVKLVI